MRTNSKKRRTTKKRNDEKRRRQMRGPNRFTCCVAAYYDPSDPKRTTVRFTAAVVELKTDRLVELLQIDSEDPDFSDPGACANRGMALARKYDATVCFVSESVPLVRCECGCDGYTVRCVTRDDLQSMRADEFDRLMAAKLVTKDEVERLLIAHIPERPRRTGWDGFFDE